MHAVKYYPAGATTNSDSGVTLIGNVYPVLDEMQRAGLPLLVHGEVTGESVDVFDRERVFIETVLQQIVRDFPALRIVVEHITTREAAEFVLEAPATIGATITPQHLLFSRNALFKGGIRPHYYSCRSKRESHRTALVAPPHRAVLISSLGRRPASYKGTVRMRAAIGAARNRAAPKRSSAAHGQLRAFRRPWPDLRAAAQSRIDHPRSRRMDRSPPKCNSATSASSRCGPASRCAGSRPVTARITGNCVITSTAKSVRHRWQPGVAGVGTPEQGDG